MAYSETEARRASRHGTCHTLGCSRKSEPGKEAAVAVQHSSALLERPTGRELSPARRRTPASTRNSADLSSEVEAMLREMAFVYQAARSVREAITAASSAPGQ